MTTTANEPRAQEATARWHADWVVTVGTTDAQDTARPSVRFWRAPSGSLSVSRLEGSDLRVADDGRFVVMFAGVLTNVDELSARAAQADAAQVVLELFRVKDKRAFEALRGPFAVVVWDRGDGTLLAARDHVGIEPFYYARGGGERWYLSSSPAALTREPGVSADPDAVAMSEWLCGWYPSVEDTTYRAVKRVPPATVVTFDGGDTRSQRYWDPFENPVEYLREQDLEIFEPLLNRAVRRSIQGRRTAVFLSGGVDSISVAAAATDLGREQGTDPPLALSLAFPDKASNEEEIQSGVASQLGMKHVIIPFAEAVGPRGLLSESLLLSASWPQPMWNIWSPGYMELARHAAAADREVILTGRGGDEWLTITPYLLADQLKRADVMGAWRLLGMYRRSNNLTGLRRAARMVWVAGCRPLASAAFDAMAPRLWHARRRRRLLREERPAWVAPDPAIRRRMEQRLDRWITPARPKNGFYHREGATAVRHPAITHDMEETQEFGRRHGLRVLHPYWDVDLIDMLHRVPPELLMADGRAKSLIRRRLAQRLPGLGLERRGKVSALGVFTGMIARDAPAEWQRLGGPRALADLGVVDRQVLETGPSTGLVQRAGGAGRLWTLLNLEGWVQPRMVTERKGQ